MAKSSIEKQVDMAVKLVLLFLVSLLSFAVGTFVGKNVAESEFRRAAIERSDYKRFTAATGNPFERGASEDEIKQLTKKFMESERKRLMKSASSSAGTEKKEGQSRKVTAAKKESAGKTPTALKTSQNSSTSSSQSEARQRKPSTVVHGGALASVSRYTLQVASYPTEGEAKAQMEKLKSMGHEAFYVKAEVKGRPWYRVNVGRFENQSSAKDYRTRLMKSSAIKDVLVKKM